MTSLMKNNIPFEQIDNGALILLLLRESKTWEELCGRYAYTDPAQLKYNTGTMSLRDKLFEMRNRGLISFDDEETEDGKKPVGEIKDTGLWSQIRVSFGGMSLSETAMISRCSNGMAVAPVFGRPNQAISSDVFVLMPFREELEPVYKDHIRDVCTRLGLTVARADDIFGIDSVVSDIWDAINGSRTVIADCTTRNPNVFYELGITHTLGKPAILITQSQEDVPFDLKHMRYVRYDLTPRGMKAFEKTLSSTLTETLGLEDAPDA